MTDQDIMTAILVNIVLGLIPALVAKHKGYPSFGWWALSALFSLFIILPIALFIKRRLPVDKLLTNSQINI